MNLLNELKNNGLHDSIINTYIFDILTKSITLFLSVETEIIERSNDAYSCAIKKGKLTFVGVESCDTESGVFDFVNANTILQADINETGCNMWLTSNQRLIIKCQKVVFEWT